MREVDLIDSGTKDTIVLVVCQEGENNSVDQALLTLRLYTKYHGVECLSDTSTVTSIDAGGQWSDDG